MEQNILKILYCFAPCTLSLGLSVSTKLNILKYTNLLTYLKTRLMCDADAPSSQCVEILRVIRHCSEIIGLDLMA